MARNLTTTEVAGMHTTLVISSARIIGNQVCDRKAFNLHQDFLLGEDQWFCSKRRQVSWVKHQY
jgi:hypothetical protein